MRQFIAGDHPAVAHTELGDHQHAHLGAIPLVGGDEMAGEHAFALLRPTQDFKAYPAARLFQMAQVLDEIGVIQAAPVRLLTVFGMHQLRQPGFVQLRAQQCAFE